LRAQLDNGGKLPFPDGILINGRGSGATLNIEPGFAFSPFLSCLLVIL